MPPLTGTGLGFRREMLDDLKQAPLPDIDFFEIAPENWLNAGGKYQTDLAYFAERFPFVCHGLSLSLGGTEPLDKDLLENVKQFVKRYNVAFYTEHLSWCTDDGHLYDLLPIPCTQEAVDWVVSRIQQAQDLLGMQIGIENASYYLTPPEAEMKEEEFISQIVRQSGCFLHLDVNNVYVNSQNFGFDPLNYLKALPLRDVRYLHVAGHFAQPDGLLIDTHGADVSDPVWDLLDKTYSLVPNTLVPTCLERDFNYPGLNTLMKEVEIIRKLKRFHSSENQETSYVRTKSA